jgi:hypothetical protein
VTYWSSVTGEAAVIFLLKQGMMSLERAIRDLACAQCIVAPPFPTALAGRCMTLAVNVR